MREVLLAVSMIVMFAFAFLVAAKIGGFLETNYRGPSAPRSRDQSVSVTFAPAQNAAEAAERIRQLGDGCDRCAVIVCGADPDIMDYLDPEWRIGDSRCKNG